MKFRTYNDCLSEAKKFTSSGEWAKGSLASYNKAIKEGWHGQIAKELGFRVKRRWTYGTCKAEASKFNGLLAWAKGPLG